MKTIYLICDCGLGYNIASRIDENGYTIDDIKNDPDLIYDIFGVATTKKESILKAIDLVSLLDYDHSIYELVKYGLTLGIVEKLKIKNVSFNIIAQNKDYIFEKFGVSTSQKIYNAYNAFLENAPDAIGFDEYFLQKNLKNTFNNRYFSLNEIKDNFDEDRFNAIKNLLPKAISKKLIKQLSFENESYYKIINKYDIKLLIKHGLSKSILTTLEEYNISFNDISKLSDNLKNNIKSASINKILDAYFNLMIASNDSDLMTLELAKKLLFKKFKYSSFKTKELIDYFDSLYDDKIFTYYFIRKIYKKNIIEAVDDLYRITPNTLEESIMLLDDIEKDVVNKKLSGLTLEAIGQEYNVTRERIRQRLAKAFKKIGMVAEDKYSSLYENYNFDKDIFCDLYDENENIYYYLKEKYKSGTVDVSEMLENEGLTSKQLNVLRKRFNLINFNGEDIIANKNNLLVAVIKKYRDTISYDDLMIEYNKSLVEYNLSDIEKITKSDFRNIDSILSRSNYVLCDAGRYFRYYDYDALDEDDYQDIINMLLSCDSGDYSTEFFFNNNQLLMKKIDIRNEYELHNFLRKKIGDLNGKIVYTRMPDILIDCEDKYQFIESLIIELSPMSIDDFVDYIYDNYGHKKSTFRSLLTSSFSKYITNSMILADCPEFTAEQFAKMREILVNDIYSVLTLKQYLNDLFNVDDFRLLNNLNMKKLGYKLRGNYIMKDNISNLESYLRNQILNNDYYLISPEMKKIGSTFTSYLYKFIYDLKLFKIDEDKYITIKKLNELGIYEVDLNEFIKNVRSLIPEKDYFNLYSINISHLISKFEKFNFPDSFYETLLINIPEVRAFRLKNNSIFIQSNIIPSRESFINSFIIKEKTYISEIKKSIYEKYDIDLPEYYIREFVNKKKYYYHAGSDCIYLNKEIFENELNSFDILQFID